MEYTKKTELVLESIQTKPGQKQLRLSKVLARFYFKEFKLIQCLRHTSPPIVSSFPCHCHSALCNVYPVDYDYDKKNKIQSRFFI